MTPSVITLIQYASAHKCNKGRKIKFKHKDKKSKELKLLLFSDNMIVSVENLSNYNHNTKNSLRNNIKVQ